MQYLQFLEMLKGHAETPFADFQKKLIPTKQKILGVRTPVMRKIAKDYTKDLTEIFAYPDGIFEVTFIKLAIISQMEYDTFVQYLPACVEKIDNWATCDCFKAKCIAKHKKEFLPVLSKLFEHGGEFYQRYVLTVLLAFYVEKEFLPIIERYLQKANLEYYYVYMSAAWLIAEILVKEYPSGLEILRRVKDAKTRNKAIQKAIESYRITKEQKEYLRSLKMKITK